MSLSPGARAVARRLARTLRWARILSGVGGAAAALGPGLLVFAGTLWGLRVLAAFGELTAATRPFLWGAGTLAGAGLIFDFARRVPWGLRGVAARLARPGHPRDEVWTAWELARRERGGEALELLLASVPVPSLSAAAPRLWPAAWRGRWLAGIAGLALLAILARGAPGASADFWPFGGDAVPGVRSIRPGSLSFPRGESVSVEVQLSGPEVPLPEPWVRGTRGPWARRAWSVAEGDRCLLVLENVREETFYRLEGGGHRSAEFALTPFDPPRLKTFSAEIRWPGAPAERAPNPFAPEVPRGVTLEFTGEWEDDVTVFRVGDAAGSLRPVDPPGPRFRWTHVVDGPTILGLWAARRGDAGAPLRVAEVAVSLRDDPPPQIRWRDPPEDLRVSTKETVALSFEATDDRGVASVQLEASWNDGPPRRLFEKSFGAGAGASGEPLVGDFVWFGTATALVPGDRLALRWRARDGSSGAGLSETRRLWVADPDADHAALVRALADWARAFSERRAEQARLVESLRAPGTDWNAAAARQSALGSALRGDAARLSALADALDEDPRASPLAGERRRDLVDALSALAEDSVPPAAAGLQRGTPDGAESVKAELDRLAAREAAARRGDDFDRWADDAADVKRATGALAEELARRTGPMTEADRADLAKTLARLEASLDRLRRAIEAGLPVDDGETPDAARRRFLRLEEVQKEFGDLTAALALGDAAAALAAARRALEKLDAAEAALRSAGGGGDDGALTSALEAWRQKFAALAEQQESLLKGTRAVSGRRTARRLAEQDRALSELPGRAAAWRDAAAALEKEWSAAVPDRALREGLWVVRAQVAALERAGTSAADVLPRLTDAADALSRLAGEWERAGGETSAGEPIVPGDPEKKYNDRKRWGDTLRRLAAESAQTRAAFGAPDGPAVDLDSEDRADTRRLSSDQGALAGDTDALAAGGSGGGPVPGGLDGPSRRAAEAASAMRQAAAALGEIRLSDGERHQANALSLLREAADALTRAGQRLAGRSAGATLRRGGARRSGGIPGGVSSPAVRLPGKSAGESSEEFRRSLQRSMKGRYPKAYEKIIQDYYRHWSK